MNIPVPGWLKDEEEFLALLHTVVDRFDGQTGDKRKNRLSFPAEKYLPSLKRLDSDADQLWGCIVQLESGGLFDIRQGKRNPSFDPDWKGAKLAFVPESEQILRAWLDRPPAEPALRQWRKMVNQYADRFVHGVDALLKRRINIAGLSDEQVVAALASLASINQPYTLRQLSCLIFNGQSKLLDHREDLITTLFPNLPLQQRALVISVHLPETCRGVLFIENQDSYAQAIAGKPPHSEQLALVYAAGFRGGAERIRDPQAALLHYSAGVDAKRSFENWWNQPQQQPPGPLYFFGDLDFSGMRILAALRQRFGEVNAWQPGYCYLLDRLTNGLGHSSQSADQQHQQDPGSTGCEFADTILLPAIREYGFIDQEAFTE